MFLLHALQQLKDAILGNVALKCYQTLCNHLLAYWSLKGLYRHSLWTESF